MDQNNQTNQTKKVNTCQQILTDGHLCKCPALRTGVFCYYHQRDRQRLRIFQKARELKQMTDSKREGFRPLDELNTEIVESLVIPALDDKASIHVAFTNITRALYCDHISEAKARLMLRAVTEASLSLRRGAVLSHYFQPADLVDPEPIRALGDEDGCVLPEERLMKQAIVDIRQHNAERADQMDRDIIAAAVARGEAPPNLPPRPLTPEEQKRNAIAAARARFDRELDDMLAQAEASGTLTDEQRTYFARQRKLRESQAGEPVPQVQTQCPSRQYEGAQDDKVEGSGTARLQSCEQTPSKGQDFSPAETDRRAAPTTLPKAASTPPAWQMPLPKAASTPPAWQMPPTNLPKANAMIARKSDGRAEEVHPSQGAL